MWRSPGVDRRFFSVSVGNHIHLSGYNNVHARNAFGRPQEAQAQVPTMAPAPPPASAPAPAPAPAPTLEVCDSFAKIKTASHAAAVRSLYEDLSQVCSADGSRFAKVEDMRMHFDWLFSRYAAGGHRRMCMCMFVSPLTVSSHHQWTSRAGS